MVVPLIAAAATTIGRIAASVAQAVGRTLAQGGKIAAQTVAGGLRAAAQATAQTGKAAAQGATQTAGMAGQTLAQGTAPAGKALAQGATQAAGTTGQTLPQTTNKWEAAKNYYKKRGKMSQAEKDAERAQALKNTLSPTRAAPQSTKKSTPTPQRTLNIHNRELAKDSKKGKKKKEQQRIGIVMALLLALSAATCDALSLITIGFSNYLLFWVPWLFALYFRSKGIRKGWLCFLAGLIEFIPIVNILNLQIFYVLAIIVSNWSQTARKGAVSPPTPAPAVNMLPNAA